MLASGEASESRPGSPTSAAGLIPLLRHLFCGGLAGLIAGVVFLGAGSRLVMRVSALLDPDADGTLTENGNVVGAVTLKGTLELVFFEGIFGGLMAGFLWVLVRQWLPQGFGARIASAGVVAALLGSFLVVSAENRDFDALDPSAANVAMFIAIVGLTGCGAAILDRRLEGLLPDRGLAAGAFAVLAVAGGVMAFAFAGQAYLSEDFCACEDPPKLAAPFIALAGVASIVSWRDWLKRSPAGTEPSWLRGAGILGVAGACLFAGIDLAGEVGKIV